VPRQAPVRGSVKILSWENVGIRERRGKFVRTLPVLGRWAVVARNKKKPIILNEGFEIHPVILAYWRKLGKIPYDLSCLRGDFAYSPARRQHYTSKKMIQSNSSSRDYGVNEEVELGGDRLPVGPALFAVFALSLLAWAVVLAPLVAILHH
jgi:hypothetical protein